MAVVVESEPVDQRALGSEAEQPRARIAGLRQRRDGADLGEAEAHAEHGRAHARVLVEACGDAERIGKRQAKRLDSQPLVVGPGAARIEPGLQRPESELVRPLGVEREKQRPDKCVGGSGHDALSRSLWHAGNWRLDPTTARSKPLCRGAQTPGTASAMFGCSRHFNCALNSQVQPVSAFMPSNARERCHSLP